MEKFLDLSEHNIINDYNQFATSDLTSVVLKAAEGTTWVDSLYRGKYNNLRGKVKIGFYHFLTSTSEPETQAENFYNNIKDYPFQVVPVVDVEQGSLSSMAENYTERFINRFKELSGQTCMIYSYYYYIKDNFSLAFRKRFNWWIASYGTSSIPSIDGCNLVAWQYSETCSDYPFVSGLVDANYLYQDKCFYLGDDYQQPNYNHVDKTIDVMQLQIECNMQGFKDCNGNTLDIDGIVGEKTISALPLIRKGATGNITMWLQSFFGIEKDGIFGENTRQAVIQFQNENGLCADGIVGVNTWRKILGV